ncbi:hypothetical protein P152DRAFT_478956 [Eremomyces bilateralis CBS 781.70]|uniref:non-specific serine/threonine protein kinase n=1 Tax=Eremomyces bilateralis CBS 781.70 TaxID=1392243 RepID=A0A6G1GEW3_9PEZI|nr:uncharacterized protein P152DRAFT_478956 [Eremomyces bilateralis CBS 781.70]KAF1816410.1 hypothetical protein P152DRAFT_478956 [Eremomyces bilateralis CBS 781.70]
MPPRQVYGRRRNATQSFSWFARTSPAKPTLKTTETNTTDEGAEDLVEKLGRLGLDNPVDSTTEGGINVGRKPLKAINGNTKLKDVEKHAQDEIKPTVSKVREVDTKKALEIPSTLNTTSGESSVDVEDADSNRSRSQSLHSRYLCSDPVARQGPTDYATYAETLEKHFNIAKIAEASYGEVYRLALKSSLPGFTAADESVLKILPLKLPPYEGEPSNIEIMSDIENVASEVRLLQRMTDIPGFTNFRDIRVLQGRPPAPIIKAWKAFNKARPKGQKSLFPDPSRKTSYWENQLWAVIEMQDAGTDLEHAKLDDIWSVWDVFWGATLTLAKGEEAARFEHRDFHLGNICVLPTCQSVDDASQRIRLRNQKLGFTALRVTVIDYTLSRAELSDPQDLDEEPRVAYLDLDKDSYLFEADSTEEYQYEIYRYMRGAVFLDDPLANFKKRRRDAMRSGRTWRGYHPQSNIVWLHFILHELLRHLETIAATEDIASSQFDTDNMVEIQQSRYSLSQSLEKVSNLLHPRNFRKSGLHSAGDLVSLALAEEWLEEADVINGVAI